MSFVAVDTVAVDTLKLLESAQELNDISEAVRQVRDTEIPNGVVVTPGQDCVSELVASSLVEHMFECHQRITLVASFLDDYAVNLTNNAKAYAHAEIDNAKGLG